MKITWLGHSCFKIEQNDYTLIIDPYEKGSVPGLLPVDEQADLILCSHEHFDHNSRDSVVLKDNKDIKNPFHIEQIQTYHDEVSGAKRGNNTIFIIDDGKQKIAHMGDLGCELTQEQKEKLANLDVLMIPVGGYYTIDGKQAADIVNELKPKLTIPMHYRNDAAGFGFDEISEVSSFTQYMDPNAKFLISDNAIYDLDTETSSEPKILILSPLRKQSR